jgi:hypothetical protein
MDIPEMEGMDMVKKYDHPSNHRLGEDGTNMAGIYMVEVDGMNMVEERPSNHQSEDESMDMVGERLSNHQSEVEGIDREDIDMVEVDVVEREHEGMVLARHWIGDGAERHHRACREWEELAKSGCSEGHTIFTSRTLII